MSEPRTAYVERLETDLAALRRENAELKAINARDNSYLTRKESDLRQKLGEAEKEVAFLRDAIEQQDLHANTAPHSDEAQQCVCKICENARQLAEQTRQLNTAEKEIARLKSDCDHWHVRVSQMKTDCDAYADKIDTLQSDLTTAQKKLEGFNMALRALIWAAVHGNVPALGKAVEEARALLSGHGAEPHPSDQLKMKLEKAKEALRSLSRTIGVNPDSVLQATVDETLAELEKE